MPTYLFSSSGKDGILKVFSDSEDYFWMTSFNNSAALSSLLVLLDTPPQEVSNKAEIKSVRIKYFFECIIEKSSSNLNEG